MGRNIKVLCADFETTTGENKTETCVWLAGFCELYTEDCVLFTNIKDFLDCLIGFGEDLIVYFHNEKFDGSFILDYFMRYTDYKQAYFRMNPFDDKKVKWIPENKMPNKSYQYKISSKSVWYSFTIKTKQGYVIKILDSYKLLPYSLERIGESFKTKHRKLSMDYARHETGKEEILPSEFEYFKHDLYVMKEGLEHMYNAGHNKLTIGSCCLYEFKRLFSKEDYAYFFPDLTLIQIDTNLFSEQNADAYIRRSYKGAWTYLVPDCANELIFDGLTLDVNSLYSSVMHSSSGNYYPVGKPVFWHGSEIPEQAIGKNKYYFIRVITSFKIKDGYLPTIQMKGDWRYNPTEFLERSALKIDGEYYEYEIDIETHEKIPVTVELTLTMTDWKLIQEHYELYNTEIISGCWFYAEIGLFDEYIDNYIEIKQNSKGAQREEAKLFLNNLYGKLATSDDSSFKIAYMDGENIKFKIVEEHEKRTNHIGMGSAVTSYARYFTITHAQKNYHGKGKRGFIYADTDSLHGDFTIDELVDIDIHPTNLSCWKCESNWDVAKFVRQKTYIEHITHENMESVDSYYNVTCAGMPKNCKKLLVQSITQNYTTEELKKMDENEKEFVQQERSIDDFNPGLVVPSKLMPKRVKGGIILEKTTFEMRKKYLMY